MPKGQVMNAMQHWSHAMEMLRKMVWYALCKTSWYKMRKMV